MQIQVTITAIRGISSKPQNYNEEVFLDQLEEKINDLEIEGWSILETTIHGEDKEAPPSD